MIWDERAGRLMTSVGGEISRICLLLVSEEGGKGITMTPKFLAGATGMRLAEVAPQLGGERWALQRGW